MAAVHFLGEELEEYISGYREQIVSFGAGVSISYIFMKLLPEFQRIASESSELIFAFPLIGFSSLHLMEKYLAKSSLPKKKLQKDYRELHSAFLFLYNGALGYLVASLLAESTVSGILFFLPIILHVAVSSFSFSELHESLTENLLLKIGLSLAPVLGVLIHNIGLVANHQFNLVFGTVIGMFFYVAIRDSIPDGDKGQPAEYLAGMAIYLTVILIANMI